MTFIPLTKFNKCSVSLTILHFYFKADYNTNITILLNKKIFFYKIEIWGIL